MLTALRVVSSMQRSPVLSGPVYERLRGAEMPFRNTIAIRFGSWREAIARAGLASPTVKGGLRVPCVVCGALFAGDNSKNARRTCSAACSSARQAQHIATLTKGEQSTVQAARGRARRGTVLESCTRCGTMSRLQVHHRDRNPYNNDPTNLEVMCLPCHKVEHRMAARSCGTCGVMFQPKNSRQRFCGNRCKGIYSARVRLAH